MGKKLSSIDSQAAFLEDLAHSCTRWDVLYIAEVDGHLFDGSTTDLFGGVYTWKRHWAGVGSVACGIVFKNSFTGLVKSLKFCGRAVLCVAAVASNTFSANGMEANVVSQGPQARSNACGVNLCFLHGSHDDLNGSLSCVASLLKKGRADFQNFLLGDFNVDMLPVATPDPFCPNIDRHMHHRDRRLQLSNLCKTFKLGILPVNQIVGGPGGPFNDICERYPITRLPVGDQTGLPSRLDYVFSSRGPDAVVRHVWTDVWADHCLLELTIQACMVSQPRRQKSTWHCKDARGLTIALQDTLPTSFSDVTALHDVCVWGFKRPGRVT